MHTGDPLHSRALAHSRAPLLTQPCPHCSHSHATGEKWARLCVFTLQGCVQAARLCRGSPVMQEQNRTPPTSPPTPATWFRILVIPIRSLVKTSQSKSYKFKKFAKNSSSEILHKTLQATHLLKLLDKMYKYEMDPTRTVGATEWTQDKGQMEGCTDVRTDRRAGRMEWNQYTPQLCIMIKIYPGIIVWIRIKHR